MQRFLAGCGLVAVGITGLVALVMNLWIGRSLAGRGPFLADEGTSINQTAGDAVIPRVIAGLVGLLMLLGYLAVRRPANFPPPLPAGLVDALGAAAFAASTAGLAIGSTDQAVHNAPAVSASR
jgi:hypothetical protein